MLISPACAGMPDPKQAGTAARENYDTCFYASAMSQLQANSTNDINAVAEQAFLACQTEEQAMYSLLAIGRFPQDEATALVVGIKVQMKKELREIIANAAKRAPSAKR